MKGRLGFNSFFHKISGVLLLIQKHEAVASLNFHPGNWAGEAGEPGRREADFSSASEISFSPVVVHITQSDFYDKNYYTA
jgi:hypothetical protein